MLVQEGLRSSVTAVQDILQSNAVLSCTTTTVPECLDNLLSPSELAASWSDHEEWMDGDIKHIHHRFWSFTIVKWMQAGDFPQSA